MVFSTVGVKNPFLYAILCLWWMTVFTELRQCQKLAFKQIWHLPATSDGYEMQEDDEDTTKITHMTKGVRITVYVAIILPKVLLAVFLLMIGSLWLTATIGFGDLILNAVALEFVISVDETIFNALMPGEVKKEMQSTVMCIPKLPRLKTTEGSWHLIQGLLFYMLVFLAVGIYQGYGQIVPYIGVLPGYAYDADCPAYWAEKNGEALPRIH